MNGGSRRIIQFSQGGPATRGITQQSKLNAKGRIRELVESKLRAGMDAEGIVKEAGLSGNELALIERYVFSGGNESVPDVARELGVNVYTARHRIRVAVQKLDGRRDWRDELKKRKGCVRIIAIVRERMERGESLEDIIERSRLNETQRKLLSGYVMANPPKKFEAAVQEYGLSRAGVCAALRSIEQKIGGEHAWPEKLREYMDMPEDELERKIRGLGIERRGQIWRKDRYLGQAANERGLVDRIFPDAQVVLLRQTLHGLMAAGGDLDDSFSSLGRMELSAVCELALVDPHGTIEGFERTHGLSRRDAKAVVHRAVSGLAPKRCSSASNRLRDGLLSWDGLEEFRNSLAGMQKDVFEIRVLHEGSINPVTLKEAGKRIGVTKQRAAQIEADVIRKAKAAMEGGYAPEWGGKRLKLIRRTALGVLERRGWDGMAHELGLTAKEEKVLAQYVMQRNRTTVEQAARRAGLGENGIKNSIFGLYGKCCAFVSRNK